MILGSALATAALGKRWTPSALFRGAAGAWYDPSDLSTLFQNSNGTTAVAVGDPVGKILDKSGNGNHLTQATSGSRPLLQQSAGLYYLDFDGTDDHMLGGDVLDLRTNGMFAVAGVKFDNTGDGGVYAKSLFGSAAGRYGMYRDSGTGQLSAVYQGSSAFHALDGDSATTTRILTQKLDRAVGTNDIRKNGVVAGASGSFTADTATDQNTAYNFRLGGYNNSGDTGILYPLDGRIYGLIIKFSPTISGAELSRVEQFLAAKAGVAL